MTENLRMANPCDAEGIKHLWKIAFGDTDDVIDEYLRLFFNGDSSAVYRCGEDVASAAHILRLGRMAGTDIDCCSLYAVATLPEYKNRGLANKTIGFALEHIKKLGAAVFLHPASEGLFTFYERAGFTAVFDVKEIKIDGNPEGAVGMRRKPEAVKVTPAEYNRAREYALRGILHIAYREEILEFQNFLSELSGGGLFLMSDEYGPACCFAAERGEGGALDIKELLPFNRGADIKNLLREITAQFGVGSARARFPSFYDAPGAKRLPFIMAPREQEGFQNEKVWFGLVFD
jgi:GNAT superfamily N-acetyltransferase